MTNGLKMIATCMLLLVGCDSTGTDTRTMPTRPVTVIELAERNYTRERQLTGVASPYREERIGFEIGGRVTKVLDKGIEVRGPTFNEDGLLIRRGDPIATLEGTRYNSQVGSLKAQRDAARQEYQSVEAEVTLARQSLTRQLHLLANDAVSQQRVDDAQSVFDQINAQLEARLATIKSIDQQLLRATEDLSDSTLFASYSGRITSVHTFEGAVVTTGQPIVTLTLMDPIQIQIEVSADDERELKTGDRVLLSPKHPFEPDKRIEVNAIVFEKSAIADPRLRTFRIDLIARNLRKRIHEQNLELKGLPNLNDYLPVVHEYQGEAGPLYISTKAVYFEKGKPYVLRLPGVSFQAGAQRSAVGKHIPERVEVKLGDQYLNVVNWNFRSVIENTELKEGDFLILHPRPAYLSGISIGRPQWLLRPQDLVPVKFNILNTPEGYYIPHTAITLHEGKPTVFRIENGVARATVISLFDSIDEYRRIEGNNITTGTQIILRGVNYVTDGQPVIVTEIVK